MCPRDGVCGARVLLSDMRLKMMGGALARSVAGGGAETVSPSISPEDFAFQEVFRTLGFWSSVCGCVESWCRGEKKFEGCVECDVTHPPWACARQLASAAPSPPVRSPFLSLARVRATPSYETLESVHPPNASIRPILTNPLPLPPRFSSLDFTLSIRYQVWTLPVFLVWRVGASGS